MNKRILLPLLVSLALQACLKAKVENVLQPNTVLNTTSSSIRLFNFSASNLDIAINNNPLTSFVNNVSTGGTQLGLTLFPNGYWPSADNGSPFNVPQVLLDKNGNAHVHIQYRLSYSESSNPPAIDTTLQDDPLNPKDYYVMDNDAHLVILNRDNTPPAQPQDIKIRIINMGQTGDPLNLSGPVVLTYADGTMVDPVTGNVGTGVMGAYAEIPYGSYEFKLFMSKGGIPDFTRQLAELPLYPNYDPCGSIPVQEDMLPQLRTFKPGGVYSVVITPNFFRYYACHDQTTAKFATLNAYRVVTEQDPGTNVTFARMQGINAMGASPVSFQVDGQPLASSLAFGKASDYSIFVQGTHQVIVLDGSGKTLVQKPITLYPYDNYALWAYNHPDGTPDILFSSVDMTGVVYSSVYINANGNISYYDDGTSGLGRLDTVPYAWETRFINLSPDVPYATFTDDSVLLTSLNQGNDSIAYTASSINMATGVLPADNPYTLVTLFGYNNAPSAYPPRLVSKGITPGELRAYSSTPTQIPGSLLTNVAPVQSSQGFVANPALYSPGYLLPAELGSYTVALIGKISASPGDPEAARLIVIKHNK